MNSSRKTKTAPHKPLLHQDVNSEEEAEQKLKHLMSGGVHHGLLTRMARHYQVDREKLQDLLLARQVVTVHSLTDYGRPACEADLLSHLRTLSFLGDIILHMKDRVSKLDEALAATEQIRTEAARVLAEYKAQIRRRPNPDQNGKV